MLTAALKSLVLVWMIAMRRVILFLQLITVCRHFILGLQSTKETWNNDRISPLKRFTFKRSLPPLKELTPSCEESSNGLISEKFDYSKVVQVVYTNNLGVARNWVEDNLSTSEPQILGWDMESSQSLPWLQDKYSSKTYFGPATIQLSTISSTLVFQIAQDNHGPIHLDGLPKFVCDILENPMIIKTGVGIDEDFIELYRWCIDPSIGQGYDSATVQWAHAGSTTSSRPTGQTLRRFDIGKIGAPNGSTIGLARLVAGVLGVQLIKSNKLARTHWSKAPLHSNEVDYAARDAWAAAAVVHRLGDLDPDRFSPASILERLQLENQRSIREASDRAAQRKAVKIEWKRLKDIRDSGNSKNDHDSQSTIAWTKDDQAQFDHLMKEMKALAPMQPIAFEVKESLGISIK